MTKAHRLTCMAVALLGTAVDVQGQPIGDVQPAERFTAEPFSRIRGIVELPGGALLVTDQIEKAVWRVDPGGGLRERVGTEGKGPNEFDTPIAVLPFRGDTVVVVDLGAGRLAFLDGSLAMARTAPLFLPEINIPQAADRNGHLWGDGRVAVRLRRRDDPRADDRAPVMRQAVDGGRLDTIAHVRVPGTGVQPYLAWDGYAVGSDGRVLIVRNQDEYRVEWVLPDGRVVRGAVIGEERRRLTASDRDAWHEKNPRGAAAGMVSGARAPGEPPPVTFPDRFPYADHSRVWVDGLGRGWVQRLVSASDTRPLLDVFDDSGRRVYRVRLPADRQVVTLGARGLYAVHVDQDGLQWLERYDLPSPQS